MAAGDSSSTSLKFTPTWALATVCFFIISVSIVLEQSIHLLSSWLKKHQKTALYDAVVRLKSELMLLGFMSLVLAVTQDRISKICVPSQVAYTMLPCRKAAVSTTIASLKTYQHSVINGGFADLGVFSDYSTINNGTVLWRSYRRLADDADDDGVGVDKMANSSNFTNSCSSKEQVSLVSTKGVHQLHLFIFALAAMQIVYSILTMALGRAKMRRWKAWEKETQTIDYQISNDPNRFRLIRATTFGRRHTTCTETSIQLWTKCFFRQFFKSVAKVDYFTLRHGFIMAHFSARLNNFNFQKYIESSLDEDFKVVVSISPFLWFLVVIFLLLDVHGWHSYLWISYIPLLIVLTVGTKLEVIVTKMALQLKDQSNVIIGAPLVELKDDRFWFKRPRFILNLLHLTLFVNAFELTFFIWVIIQFGFDSCYHQYNVIIITRVVLAVTVQVLCSYITLPLYALVTQMGSEYKGSILKEQTVQILKQWHAGVRDKRKKEDQNLKNSPRLSSARPPSTSSLPAETNPTSGTCEITEEEAEQI